MHKRLAGMGAILGAGLLAAGAAQAQTFINFIEGLKETDPVVIQTNMLPADISASGFTNESAFLDGFLQPVGLPPLPPGQYAAGMLDPDPGNPLSDYVLLHIDPPLANGQQHFRVEFFSDINEAPLTPPIPLNGSVIEDGTLQNLTPFLGIPAPGALTISAVSSVPEVGTYALMLAGLGALGFWSRRRMVGFD